MQYWRDFSFTNLKILALLTFFLDNFGTYGSSEMFDIVGYYCYFGKFDAIETFDKVETFGNFGSFDALHNFYTSGTFEFLELVTVDIFNTFDSIQMS